MAEAKKKTVAKATSKESKGSKESTSFAKASEVKRVKSQEPEKTAAAKTTKVTKEVEATPDSKLVTPDSGDEVAVAKSGKRSAKAVAEVEAKEAKAAHKAEASEHEATPAKKVHKPARPKLERRGKKFREAAKLIEKGKVYPLKEAMELAVKSSPVKFDATLELHVRLNVDPKQADQNVRGTVVLPGGTGKTLRVAVFDDAKAEGADISGVETVIKALEKGELNFDILIATPANMAKLGKYARLLGPKGLMPNPKSGTVTNDVAKAVKEAKAGRVEYRVDSTGIVHLGVGKVSFGAAKLLENVQAVLDNLKNNKPASVKSGFVKSAHLTTSMGPSVPTLVE